MLPSPSQQLFHPNSFTVTPQTFPSFPPTTMCTSTQTLTSPFPPQLLPHYDSSSPSGTVPTGVQAWDAGERWAPGGCNSPQPPPPTPQNVPVPARRRWSRTGPCCAAAAPPFARSGGGSKIRPPAVFCPPAGRTADCGDQPGFGEFLVPPPPLFVGRTIFCAECGWRAPMYALDGRPRPSTRLPAVMLHSLTRAWLKHPG